MSRKITHGIIHCADTPADMDIGAKEIRDWHVNGNGWSDIGYHSVIRRDGTIEKGRDIDISGAHAKGHNKHSIGICLVGGMGGFNFTREQMKSLDYIISAMEKINPDIEILGHCDLPGVTKTCPNFDVMAWRGNK
ncbi:MAG: N-acetylmuramoyl-L-alanine amidase [Gammaproteobacteria bacterium]|nr:N-acetylmuramoyl-L-alanine amidase [Gammaproteobacteria bacterium]